MNQVELILDKLRFLKRDVAMLNLPSSEAIVALLEDAGTLIREGANENKE